MQKRTGQGLAELREAIKPCAHSNFQLTVSNGTPPALHFENEIGFENKTVSTTNV